MLLAAQTNLNGEMLAKQGKGNAPTAEWRGAGNHRLGFSLDQFGQVIRDTVQLRVLSGEGFVEGFDFENLLVKASHRIGNAAWKDELFGNPGADVYIAHKKPSGVLLNYLRRKTGKDHLGRNGDRSWEQYLLFKKNKPMFRLEAGLAPEELPRAVEAAARAFVSPISAKAKASGNEDPEVLEYDLLRSLPADLGEPDHSHDFVDGDWTADVLARAAVHCKNYENTIIGQYVPVADDDGQVAVEMTLHELPSSSLIRALEKAEYVMRQTNPYRAAEEAGLELSLTGNPGTVTITCFDDDFDSLGWGDRAPRIRFKLTSGGLSLKVHSSVAEPCGTATIAPPDEKVAKYRETARKIELAKIHRGAVENDEPVPAGARGSKRDWYWLRRRRISRF